MWYYSCKMVQFFEWINQPIWHHYDTIWKWCHPVLYSHWLVIIDYAKQVHTCKRYIYWSNMIDSPSYCPFVTSSLLLYPRHCAAHHHWSAPLPCYTAWGPGHSLDPLCPCPSQVDPLSPWTLLVISRDLLLGVISHSSQNLFYVQIGTQHDISFAVSHLVQYAANPSPQHLQLAQYVLSYLVGTVDMKFFYDGANGDSLHSFTDSRLGDQTDNRHSTPSYVFILANGAISWSIRKTSKILRAL